jgi:hypothetical protein
VHALIGHPALDSLRTNRTGAGNVKGVGVQ